MDYKIANVSKEECDAINEAEKLVKNETGKNFVLIAYEKTKEDK